MFGRHSSTKGICSALFVLVFVVGIPSAEVWADSARGCGFSFEKATLSALNLKENVDDTQIIQLLDVPDKRILATALISSCCGKH